MSHPKVLLDQLGASARKSLSQNFLTSPHWADKLTDLVLEPPDLDEVWEIGPGLGALTDRLLAKTKLPVRAFEYDRKLSEYLRQTYPQLDLHEGDALDADMEAISPGAKRIAVLSNLPYHLSSPLLFKLLESPSKRFPRLVLTFQKEFARRLAGTPRTPDYGALSVVVQLRTHVTSAGILPPGAFFPPPAVASEALVIEPREPEPGAPDMNAVSKLVRGAFAHRRKKLASNLRELFEGGGATIDAVMAELKLQPMVRPEELDALQYKALTARLLEAGLRLLSLFLVVCGVSGNSANASQDRNYGLGGSSSGRVGSVTAEEENPYAALLNPALLAAQRAPQVGVSTAAAHASFDAMDGVVLDGPTYRTQDGEARRGEARLRDTSLSLWSAGLTYPFALPLLARRSGIGVALSGPFSRLRALAASTPYDFTAVRYGTADAQFKGTASGALELWRDTLFLGAGLSFFVTGAGNADATIAAANPTGRLALDVGWNSATVAGLYGRFGKSGASLVHRQAIVPTFTQAFTGNVQLGGTDALAQPMLLQSTLYYEPQTVELEVQHAFVGLKVSAGLLYQAWSGYRPSYLVMQTRTAAGEIVATQTPAISFRDTVTPRVSVEAPLFHPRLVGALGYQYRPTPVGDLSGTGNLLDASAHVTGASVAFQLSRATQIGLFGQVHWLVARSVAKSGADFVGAPGYRFSGRAATYGLSLQAAL